MIRRVTLLTVAEDDINRAVGWYDTQQPGLGDAFVADIADTVAHIEGHPEMYQVVAHTLRRAVLHTFPYSILYRVLPAAIEVVGVFHSQIDPARVSSSAKTRRTTQ